ncbi:MAG: phosphoenolpyruvate carboxykinase [Myxococcota bacterium]|nr:phosphoenolpyruvate carboxykinase [Myxococcota bacterium]
MSTSANEFILDLKNVIRNPDPNDLRGFVGDMPNAQKTEFGNYNVKVKVKARSKASTYIVTDTPDNHTDQTMSRNAAESMAKVQNDYIRTQEMIVVDGFIGDDPLTRTACRLTIERRNANIAAMQQQLYFTPSAQEFSTFVPELNVIYTPNLPAKGYPNDRLISVDLENNTTRVFNSDYFGESKKGGLRMWNKLIYDRGGLPLHAGCKVVPSPNGNKTLLIVGLSGTGKTTTTFTCQNESMPVQDDFVALMPNGGVLGTEDGCFAKTFGLDPTSEPLIYQAVTQPETYLENVSVDENGKVYFNDQSHTQNGRATFPFRLIPNAANPRELQPVSSILILNRNDNIVPALARLNKGQGAAYFMLGESQGTSAGGKEEAGKALRVPGTNPFFPLLHGLQGNRFLELSNKIDMEVFLLNTGWVGGGTSKDFLKKVKIHHSSTLVKAIVDDSIEWSQCRTFGYQVPKTVPGFINEDNVLLQPLKLYEETNRRDEFNQLAHSLKTGRVEHLDAYPNLDPALISAIA